MLLLPFPAIAGVCCLVSFIVVISLPPHTFSRTAQGLLAAFFVLYFGFAIVGAAWLLWIECVMYRMWLASFESAWVEREERGWWGRFVGVEMWLGRVEFGVYMWVRGGVRWMRRVVGLGGKEKLDE
jgi:uncharacterized SAM-binding protein YcdF (DUF218 family)